MYFAGVGIVAALLAYEQSLVRADDLSQVKRAFDLNGYVGILYLLVLIVSLKKKPGRAVGARRWRSRRPLWRPISKTLHISLKVRGYSSLARS